jgi:hypothetical protein
MLRHGGGESLAEGTEDMRDEFPPTTRRTLAARAGHHCSNPECNAPTSGPNSQADAMVDLGIAAHITAAAPGGPRYDSSLSKRDRTDVANGIWLCRTCATLIDCDLEMYSQEILVYWRERREREAQAALGRPRGQVTIPSPSNEDRELFREFLECLPYEGSIRFINEANMAGFAFDRKGLKDLDQFHYTWVDAVHEFQDALVETKRKHLFALVRGYLVLIATNTWATSNGWYSVPQDWETDQPARFFEVVEQLHTLAGGIVAAHQDLVRTARQRFL